MLEEIKYLYLEVLSAHRQAHITLISVPPARGSSPHFLLVSCWQIILGFPSYRWSREQVHLFQGERSH